MRHLSDAELEGIVDNTQECRTPPWLVQLTKDLKSVELGTSNLRCLVALSLKQVLMELVVVNSAHCLSLSRVSVSQSGVARELVSTWLGQ